MEGKILWAGLDVRNRHFAKGDSNSLPERAGGLDGEAEVVDTKFSSRFFLSLQDATGEVGQVVKPVQTLKVL